MIVQDADTGDLSIIDGGLARSLSTQVYVYLGEPPATSISDDLYKAIPTGPAYFPNGMIVQDASTDVLSVIDGGQARPLSTQGELYLGNPQVTDILDAQYTSIPAGPAYYPNGMVVQDVSTGALSIIVAGQARSLSTQVDQYLGNPQVTSILDGQYTAIPVGTRRIPQRHDRPGRPHRRPQHYRGRGGTTSH